MSEQKPSNRVDPMSTRNTDWYWEEAAKGELKIQQCDGCKHLWHPPRPVCPKCHSTELSPKAMSGRGTVYSFIQIHYPPPIGFEDPPIVALVDLEEDNVRLITNIIDAKFEDLKNGAPVEVDFEKTAKGKSVPVFRLASATKEAAA